MNNDKPKVYRVLILTCGNAKMQECGTLLECWQMTGVSVILLVIKYRMRGRSFRRYVVATNILNREDNGRKIVDVNTTGQSHLLPQHTETESWYVQRPKRWERSIIP